MSAPSSECSWFEHLLESGNDLSEEDEARYLAHLENCAHHRQASEDSERIIRAQIRKYATGFKTSRVATEADFLALASAGARINLRLRMHQNEEPIAQLQRDGRLIGYLRLGEVIFNKTATLDDRIAVVRLLDEL